MDNSLLAVRNINHKYIVVEGKLPYGIYVDKTAAIAENELHTGMRERGVKRADLCIICGGGGVPPLSLIYK